jgi:hypothetical protein
METLMPFAATLLIFFIYISMTYLTSANIRPQSFVNLSFWIGVVIRSYKYLCRATLCLRPPWPFNLLWIRKKLLHRQPLTGRRSTVWRYH